MDRVLAALAPKLARASTVRLQQAQLAGTGDRFGAPLDLEFAEDFPIVPFHRVQGEEQPLADLAIRESLGQELEYLQLALAQWLGEGLGRWGGGGADRSAPCRASAWQAASNVPV